jgi:hypothetical protein
MSLEFYLYKFVIFFRDFSAIIYLDFSNGTNVEWDSVSDRIRIRRICQEVSASVGPWTKKGA